MNFQQVYFETSFGRLDQLPPSQLPEIVFAGRSNVGKSSLINKLFNQKSLARVSATPGKTATINFFRGEEMRFVDLPGYGYAKVSKEEKLRWAALIEGYFAQGRDIRLVCSLVDIRHKPTNDDLMMIEFLIENEIPFLVVLTKADKLSNAQQQKRLEELIQELPYGDQITVIPFSTVTGKGVEELRAIINEIEADQEEEPEQDSEHCGADDHMKG